MSHDTSLGSPKWDHPNAGDQPTPSYDPSFSSYPVRPGRGQSLQPSHSMSNYHEPLSPYPQLPQPSGFTRALPRMPRNAGGSLRQLFWTLRLALVLVNVVGIAYCLYYLMPFAHLVVFGITLHP